MICHAIERTSPKGGPFLGTCMRCGRTGLPMSAATEPCDNIAGMTNDEALLAAIDPLTYAKKQSGIDDWPDGGGPDQRK